MVYCREDPQFTSVRQIGLLTANIEKFIANMKEIYGLAPDRTARYPAESGPEDCIRKLAFYNFPEVELEVVEPVNTSQAWLDFLKKHGDCLQHVQFNVKNLSAAIQQMEAHGIRLIERGFSITNPKVEFLFFDTLDTLGYVTEVVNFREFE